MTNETNSPASPEMPVVKLESTGLEAQTPSGGTVIGARTADGNGVGFIFTNVKGEVTNLATRWETFEAAISLFNELRDALADRPSIQGAPTPPAPSADSDGGATHRQLIEAVAKAIYRQWVAAPGFVPWVEGGNAENQDDARRIARKAIEEAHITEQGEAVAPEAKPTDAQHEESLKTMERRRYAAERVNKWTAEIMAASDADREAVVRNILRISQDHIDIARSAASSKAWADLCERFTDGQRQTIANLLAHSWTIRSISMKSKYCTDAATPKVIDGTATPKETK